MTIAHKTTENDPNNVDYQPIDDETDKHQTTDNETDMGGNDDDMPIYQTTDPIQIKYHRTKPENPILTPKNRQRYKQINFLGTDDKDIEVYPLTFLTLTTAVVLGVLASIFLLGGGPLALIITPFVFLFACTIVGVYTKLLDITARSAVAEQKKNYSGSKAMKYSKLLMTRGMFIVLPASITVAVLLVLGVFSLPLIASAPAVLIFFGAFAATYIALLSVQMSLAGALAAAYQADKKNLTDEREGAWNKSKPFLAFIGFTLLGPIALLVVVSLLSLLSIPAMGHLFYKNLKNFIADNSNKSLGIVIAIGSAASVALFVPLSVTGVMTFLFLTAFPPALIAFFTTIIAIAIGAFVASVVVAMYQDGTAFNARMIQMNNKGDASVLVRFFTGQLKWSAVKTNLDQMVKSAGKSISAMDFSCGKGKDDTDEYHKVDNTETYTAQTDTGPTNGNQTVDVQL